jgi:hypothetical protein
MYFSQACQDKFILNILKAKKNGFFLEIGSNHPISINNTYTLEKNYNWKGIMIEYNSSFLDLYKEHRPNSIHIIDDATKIDYRNIFKINNMPIHMDYLQIDLEVNNRSTLTTLEILDNDIFDEYKFATITFEHDIYSGNYFDTREKSRQIFNKRGYICVFQDVCDHKESIVFEDWYVYPDLVNMEYINKLIHNNIKNYNPNNITEKSINCQNINYPCITTICFGNSNNNLKSIDITDKLELGEAYTFDLVKTGFPDTFEFIIKDNFLIITRLDYSQGWGHTHSVNVYK